MNKRQRIKELTTLACAIAHANVDRGIECVAGEQDCHEGALHAHHCVPRSRGWDYATNWRNIVLLCTHHDTDLHAGGHMPLEVIRVAKEVLAETPNNPRPVTDADIMERARLLAPIARTFGVDVAPWIRNA